MHYECIGKISKWSKNPHLNTIDKYHNTNIIIPSIRNGMKMTSIHLTKKITHLTYLHKSQLSKKIQMNKKTTTI